MGVLLDAVVISLHVTHCDCQEEFSPSRLLPPGFNRALAEYRQLHLAHGALHPEQQPVVGRARIIDAVLIDDQRADYTAELQQRVPVASVAGEPRCLDRQDGPIAAPAEARLDGSLTGRSICRSL